MCPINSDEHDTEDGVRSEPGQPPVPEHRDKPGVSSPLHKTERKQGGDGRELVETNITGRF